MNENKLVKEWVRALRSGEYKKGEGALVNVNNQRYCCLGVLCKVKGMKDADIAQLISHASTNQLQGSYLPDDILKETGMRDEHQKELARMNDVERMDFDDIATFIEDHFLYPNAGVVPRSLIETDKPEGAS